MEMENVIYGVNCIYCKLKVWTTREGAINNVKSLIKNLQRLIGGFFIHELHRAIYGYILHNGQNF